MNHQQARADIAAQIARGNVESFCEGDDAIRHLSKLFIVRNTRRRAGESDDAYAARVGSLLTDMLDAIGQVLVGANVNYVLADAADQPVICRTREASLLAISRQVAHDVLMARGVA
ncbi:hypothetical protein CF68_33220 [Cupriavidus sp. SK-4]|uniref:hypothetical protein n=1 Tax=Cupriavidus sp. SK-4 TaxID=574750 RepID=UPI000445A40C|nr:hypothetical protein [Cupriavidus sp. SK-4]EYS89542.1 hypothetical protein CF68_33220 [Cupriavidus sp. SK-4]